MTASTCTANAAHHVTTLLIGWHESEHLHNKRCSPCDNTHRMIWQRAPAQQALFTMWRHYSLVDMTASTYTENAAHHVMTFLTGWHDSEHLHNKRSSPCDDITYWLTWQRAPAQQALLTMWRHYSLDDIIASTCTTSISHHVTTLLTGWYEPFPSLLPKPVDPSPRSHVSWRRQFHTATNTPQ